MHENETRQKNCQEKQAEFQLQSREKQLKKKSLDFHARFVE